VGGPDGNEILTTATAVVLPVLLAALGITITDMGGLVRWHMILGMLLIPPVLLKLASTGYRFMRYYRRSAPYRAKGPPLPALRVLAPRWGSACGGGRSRDRHLAALTGARPAVRGRLEQPAKGDRAPARPLALVEPVGIGPRLGRIQLQMGGAVLASPVLCGIKERLADAARAV
jgi:hypothetical protein